MNAKIRPSYWIPVIILSVLVAFFSTNEAAAEGKKLTNKDIIKMSKNGLTAEDIVEKVKANGHQFDFSKDGLAELTMGGVPPSTIIAVKVHTTETEEQPAPSDSDKSGKPSPPPGTHINRMEEVALIDGNNRIQLQYRVPRTRSENKYGADKVVTKTTTYQFIDDGHAPVRITSGSPVFETLLPADASPLDHFEIIKLDTKGDTREVQIAKVTAKEAINEIPKDHIVPITFEEIQPGDKPEDKKENRPEHKKENQPVKLYRIKPVGPLAPGEYAFLKYKRIGFYYDFNF